MQYFSGRFKEKASDLILDFHSSISFDQRLYKYDIMGSIAHVRGLEKQEIILKHEAKIIENALRVILQDIENGAIKFTVEYEDIHMNIEKILIDRIGDVGKKLHTGRSRNDQIAVDMKLFAKDEVKKIQASILELMETIYSLGENNIETYMPGFTHLQKAQPISFSHYILAYAEMFKRDFIRFKNSFELLDSSPLGSAALAGTTYPLDREYIAVLLGFKDSTWNSLDGVSDRDYMIEILNDISISMMHLSRLAEEIIIYSSNDYGYIELSDGFSTGSSIMPQKKNPDAAELVRGKTGRVYGNLIALLTVMKGLPLAYNKDMQEDKEAFFDSIDTIKGCLKIFNGMLKTIAVNKKRMLEACKDGFINATDLADYLTKKGLNFRDSYKIVGSIVAYGMSKNLSLDKLELKEYKNFSDLFQEDLYDEISIKNCVMKRTTKGSPNENQIRNHLEEIKKFIEFEGEELSKYTLNNIL